MECFCEQKETYELKVEGDVGADPIWCNQCGCNLDIDDLPISDTLTNELIEWVNRYGEWIDWDEDKLLPNGIELEEEHNKQGLTLTEKTKKELEGKYRIKFSPSTMARMYAHRNH
jgi:transcription elongation factor Elf1